MPIVRFEPGAQAWADGLYALVNHYGEPTDFSVWLRRGETFPPVISSDQFGPLWYVRTYVADEKARVG